MTHPATPQATLHLQTRERLADGSFARALRAAPPAGVRLRSDEELRTTLADALHAHDPDEDVHVFGYGSLMWNPALETCDTRVARVPGWHRRFCLRSYLGRGTPETPGVMLALDRGGACRGLLLRIAAANVRKELGLLWQREMVSGSYHARWVCAHAGTERVRALTFVVDRSLERYIADRTPEPVAQLILAGRGAFGTAREYFDSTRQALRQLGIRDPGIERLHRAVLAASGEAPLE